MNTQGPSQFEGMEDSKSDPLLFSSLLSFFSYFDLLSRHLSALSSQG